MKHIEETLLNFLHDDTKKVGVLKGKWGVGKTYFWNNFFKENKKEINQKAYSYVSLFGLSSISDLNSKVFSNHEALDDTFTAKVTEKLKPFSKILEISNIPHVGSTSAASRMLENYFVNDFLVCVDDFERKENSISASSILGWVSQLKEEKSCKILLIYNEDEIDEESKKEINEYREKVVDFEITYAPTIKDNLRVIWPDGSPESVSELFEKLNFNNIRVMQKVKWSLNYFIPKIKETYPSIIDDFKRKTVLLTYLYHTHGSKVTIKEIISTNIYVLMMNDDKENKDKSSRFQILKDVNYHQEDFDYIIGEYLTQGFVDLSKYDGLLLSVNEKYNINNVNDKLRRVWEKYHRNFTTSQEEFITAQLEFLNQNENELGFYDKISVCTFLQKLNFSEDLEKRIEEEIEAFVEEIDDLDFFHMKRSIPQDIINRVVSKFKEKVEKVILRDVMYSLGGENGFNPKDLNKLSQFSSEDLYYWMTTEIDQDVISILKEVTRRFGGKEEEVEIMKCLYEAMERLKRRETIDKYRIEYLIEEKDYNP